MADAGGGGSFDVLVVGAGAAGLAAAIFTARRFGPERLTAEGRAPRLRIACLDGARKIGAKILVSGGGRCNVTNVEVRPEDFFGGSRNSIRRVLSAFTGAHAVEFFRGLGVSLHEEQWGKLFPDSNSAKTVLNALLAECERLGVAVLPGRRVVGIERGANGTGFLLAAQRGEGGVGSGEKAAGSTRAETAARARAAAASLPPSLPRRGQGAVDSNASREAGEDNPPISPLSKGGGAITTGAGPITEGPITEGPITKGAVTEGATTAGAITPGAITAPARVMTARAVVLATGGMSLPKTGSDGFGYELARGLGHTVVPTTPGLAPLVLEGDFHAPMAGISHEVEVLIAVEGQKPVRIGGPMLWTHFGASGPAILDASRHWHRAVLEGRRPRVSLNLLPGMDFEAAEAALLKLAASQPSIAVRNALGSLLPARLGEAILRRLEVPPARTIGQVTREDRRRLVHALLDWPLPVVGSRGYKYAEVTAGGVPLSEIDTSTMESRVCPGLFLVGEILDVDGRIGGFNFQWAWSSSYVAGIGLQRRLAPG